MPRVIDKFECSEVVRCAQTEVAPATLFEQRRNGGHLRTHQVIDGEYMHETERPHLIRDLDDFASKAKDSLSRHLCASGSMPTSHLVIGTPEEVREYAQQLIDCCGRGGGFVMSSRTPVDDARPVDLRALVDFTIECGVYS